MRITPLHLCRVRLRSFTGVCAVLLSIPSAQAGIGERIKQNNTTALNLAGSWDTAPASSDVGSWTSTVTGSNTVALGANLNWQGLKIVAPGGLVTISAGNTLTLGGRGIDLSAATSNLTIQSGLALRGGSGQIWNVASGRTLTLETGVIARSACATLNVQGPGTVSASMLTNDVTGQIGPWATAGTGTAASYAAIGSGGIVAYTGAAAATAAAVTSTTGLVNYDVAEVGALGTGASFNTLRYSGAAGGTIAGNFSANGILTAGGGEVSFSGTATIGAARELVVMNGDNNALRRVTLSGVISDNASGASGITKGGEGSLVLSGANTYTGVTTVTRGLVQITSNNALGSADAGTRLSGGIGTDNVSDGYLFLVDGVNTPEPVFFDSVTGSVLLAAAGASTLSGPVRVNSSVRLGGGGTTTNFSGGLSTTGGTGGTFLLFNLNTTVTGKPIINGAGSLYMDQSQTRILGVGGNVWGTTTLANGILRTDVANALAPSTSLQMGSNGTLDLNGNNQLGGELRSTAFIVVGQERVVTSAAPATLTLNPTGTTIYDGKLTGAVSLTKNNTGTLTLSGPSTTTGTFTVNGGTLNESFDRAASSASAVSNYLPVVAPLTLGGGTFQLIGRQDGAATAVTGTWATAASTLTAMSSTATLAPGQIISGSGIPTGTYIVSILTGLLNIIGNQVTISANTTAAGTAATLTPTASSFSTAQTFAGIRLNAGAANVTVNANGAATPATVLNLGAITPNAGGTVNFTLPAGTQSATNGITLSNTNSNHILGGWARVGDNWAANRTNAAGGNVAALASYTDVTRLSSGTKAITADATANVRIIEGTGTAASLTPGAAGTTDINTLLQSATGAVTYDPGTSDVLRLGAAGGILVAGNAGALTIGTGVIVGKLTAGGAANADGTLYLINNHLVNVLTINSTITNNGSGVVGVTTSGAGVTTLAGANTHTGRTIVGGSGMLVISSEANLGATPASVVADQITLAGGTLRNTSAINLSVNRGITVTGSNSFLDTAATLTVNGVISGTGILSKPSQSGTGNLVLTAANTFSGTLVNQSTSNVTELQLGNVNALQNATLDVGNSQNQKVSFTVAGTNTYNLGGLQGSDEIALGANSIRVGSNNSTTTYSGNFTGVIAGGGIAGFGGLTKVGTGTLQLTGANNFYGDTLVSAGMLVLVNSNALQSSTLDTGPAGSQSVNLTLPEGTTYNLGGLKGTADLDMAVCNLSVGGNNQSSTYSGSLKGAFNNNLIKVGTGTLTLTGANTCGGTTTVSAGTLQLDGSAAGTLAVGAAGTLTGSATVNGNATVTGSGVINKPSGTITGSLGVTGGNWNGAGSVTGAVTVSSGTLTLGAGAKLTAVGGLNVTGGSIAGTTGSTLTGSVNYTSSTGSSFGGNIAGSGKTLTLNRASSTLALTGPNTYSGATWVTAGTLVVNSSLASSGVSVASGATLQGGGSVSNGVTAAGTLAPGNNAAGTLSVGTASFAPGGILAVKIDGATSDQLVASGTLNLSGATLTVTLLAGGWTQTSYVIAQGAPLTGTFASVPPGFAVDYTATQATLRSIAAYYVSPSGSDSNDGLSAAAPFATIQHAATLMVAGNTCLIRGGIYHETVTVTHSGAADAPITFAAYNNESVTISGADPIASWTLESPNIYRADAMPAGWATLGDKNQVFQGGGTQDSLAMQPEARWPNPGATFPWQDSSINPSPDWAYVESAGYDANGLHGWFSDALLPERTDGYWIGARVHIMLGDGWYTFNPAVTSYTEATKTMVTDENHGPVSGGSAGAYTMKAGNEFYLSGKKGEMDSAGEWFYDPSTAIQVLSGATLPANRLCIYSAAPPANVQVKVRPYGFKLTSRSFINLTHIHFFACTLDPATPYVTDSVFDGLAMKYLSHSRLRDGEIGLTLGSRCVLRNSELAFSSMGLLSMQGSDMRVINNHLHDAAYVPAGVGAITANGNGSSAYAANRNLISHNTIHAVGHAAIGYPGRFVIIEYNDLYDGMKGSTDGGLCYWASDGGNSFFRYNLIHDASGPVGHSGNGVQGFYLDNQHSGWIIHHNLIWNIHGYAMQINAPCSYDMIFNNTTWNCSSGAILNSFWVDGPTGNHIYNNLFNGAPAGNQSVWSQSDLRFNLYTDPLLVDPANRNFQLQGASPALDAGTAIPGITDGFSGSAPDLGALESGAPDWTSSAGCNAIPPTPDPVYATPALTYANQVRDGGFETGSLSPNWTVKAGSNLGLIQSLAWVDHKLHSSYYGLQFGGGAAESEISQNVSGLQAGKRYKFYSTVQKTDVDAVVKVGVRSYGSPDQEVTVPTTGTWGNSSVSSVPTIFEVPFFMGADSTSATVYVKVTRAVGSLVAPKNVSNGSFPTVAATVTNLSSYNSSALVSPMYPATGVYLDDMAVILSQENTDPSPYRMPVVSYAFDESSGLTAHDSSTNGKDATLTGATFTAGHQGNALTFTGATQSAKATAVTVPALNGSFTVAFWLKLNNVATGEQPKPFSNAGWLQKGWHITCAQSSYSLAMYVWDSSLDGFGSWLSQPLTAGVWTHIAYAFDRTNGVLVSYRDGLVDGSTAIPAGLGDISNAAGLQMGGGMSNGQMDDVKVWNYALSATAVAAAIQSDPAMQLRLKFDESAGATKAWDSSIYQRTGVLTNMAAATAWVSGMIDGALAFDGVNDSVVTPAITTPAALTVGCWAKSATATWNATGCLVSRRPAFVLSPVQGSKNLQFIVYSTPTTPLATPAWIAPAGFDITQWHHYGGVFNPSTGRVELYVDGLLVSLLNTAAAMHLDSGAVFVGRDGSSGGSFNGAIDDVRIYSRALDWSGMMDLSRQTAAQPYAASSSMILAADEDGDGLPSAWERFYGLDPLVVNNPADDSDHDGLGLMLEYALNQSPLADSSAALPRVTTVVDTLDHQSYLTFTYRRRTDAPQLTYTVQVSDDLLTWHSGPACTLETGATPSGDGVTEIVTTRILPAITAGGGRRLARLSVGTP